MCRQEVLEGKLNFNLILLINEILQNSIFTIFIASQGNSNLTKPIILALKLLPMCIKESLRLFPPVIALPRCPNKPSKLDKYNIPKGVLVIVATRQLHNHVDLWDKPDEFNPYRFSAENIGKIPPFTYIPFSAGSRNCIGQNMAMNELTFVIARILTRFKLSLPSDFPEKLEFEFSLLMKPNFPLRLVLSPI